MGVKARTSSEVMALEPGPQGKAGTEPTGLFRAMGVNGVGLARGCVGGRSSPRETRTHYIH